MRPRTWPLGRGTRAARGAIKSSGSNSTWGVPSLKGRFHSSTPRPSPWPLKRCSAMAPRARYRPTRSSVARSFGSPATAQLSEQPSPAVVKGLAKVRPWIGRQQHQDREVRDDGDVGGSESSPLQMAADRVSRQIMHWTRTAPGHRLQSFQTGQRPPGTGQLSILMAISEQAHDLKHLKSTTET